MKIEQSSNAYVGHDGISNHSSDERYIILSPDGPFDEFEKFCGIFNIGFKKVTGRYKGHNEISYVINARDIDYIVDAGHIHNQEAILYLSPISYGYIAYGEKNRVAVLHYTKGDTPSKELGVFRAVDRDKVKMNDFTYDPSTETYYMIFNRKGEIVNAT